MYSHIKQSLVAVALFALALVAPLSVGAQDAPQSGEQDYRAIQGMLNKAGLDAGPEDGQWGPASRRAMRAFQASVGLPDTGSPDPATLAALRNQLNLPTICSIGLELNPGQGCEVPGAGTFSLRADGCVDEMPSIPSGSTPNGRPLLSIGRMNSTFSGGNSQSCMSGHLEIGPFRASEVSGTSRWRIDALPGVAPRQVVEASQDLPRARETRDRLFSSIIAEDLDGVMRAIEEGANVNDLVDGSDLKGASALLVAVSRGNAEIVRILVETGADANHALPEQDPWSKASGGTTALSVAVDKEHVQIVRMLVEVGADVNHVLPGDQFGRSGSTESTVLFKAVNMGNTEIARMLVEAGANVNYVLPEQRAGGSRTGMSALLLAVDKEYAEIVRLLVEADADTNHVLPEQERFGRSGMAGASALLIAVGRENEQIVRTLVEAGADANYVLPMQRDPFSESTSGMSALLLAVDKEHVGIVRLLVGAGARVNYVLPREQSPRAGRVGSSVPSALLAAVLRGNAEIVRILVEAGANANYVFPERGFGDNSGVSALILAAAKGDEEITHLLVESGANVNYQIPESVFPARTAGLTALRIARAQNHKGVVKLLKRAGARR